MTFERMLLLGGLQLGPDNALVAASNKIDAVAMIEDGVPVPLHGCALYAEMTVDATAPVEQTVILVEVLGPSGVTLPLVQAALDFGPPGDQRRGASLTVRLDGLGIQAAGDHTFRFVADGGEAGELRIVAAVAHGRARAKFGGFIQESQGVSGDQRYLSGRLPFTFYQGDAFGGYHAVGISQRQGGNFAEDPLDLQLSPGYERLQHAYGFTAAVHQAYDLYARQIFGGNFADGSTVTMSNNVIISETTVEFDLPEPTAQGGW